MLCLSGFELYSRWVLLNKARNMILFCLEPGQCFTCVAKMRRNTVTLDDGNWTIANLETCSFIRFLNLLKFSGRHYFNNAFRKTLLQAAKRKTRKLTDHRKQLLSRALISSRLVLSYEYENCGKWSPVVMFRVGPGEGDEERCRQHYKHMILGFISV